MTSSAAAAAVVALGYFTDIVDFTELKAVFSLKLTALLKLAVMVLLVLLATSMWLQPGPEGWAKGLRVFVRALTVLAVWIWILRPLGRARDWLVANNGLVVGGVLALIGLKLLLG